MSSYVKRTYKAVRAIMLGFWTTFRHLFSKPVTIPYPDEKRELPPRYRARIALTRDPDGQERCVACYLCAAVCPVDCISMQATEGDHGRRYADWFRINFSRCIYCGLCEEACPTAALQMTTDYEMCADDIDKMVWEKSDLTIDGTGRYPDYNFYRQAGVAVVGEKGTNPSESTPVDPRSNLP